MLALATNFLGTFVSSERGTEDIILIDENSCYMISENSLLFNSYSDVYINMFGIPE